MFLDVIPHIRSVPVVPSWSEIEDALSKDLEAAVYGQVTAHVALARGIERTLKYFDD